MTDVLLNKKNLFGNIDIFYVHCIVENVSIRFSLSTSSPSGVSLWPFICNVLKKVTNWIFFQLGKKVIFYTSFMILDGPESCMTLRDILVYNDNNISACFWVILI